MSNIEDKRDLSPCPLLQLPLAEREMEAWDSAGAIDCRQDLGSTG
jgi:hypothetical protein